jgi:hypothetical protein
MDKPEPTTAVLRGRIIHSLILEPEKFDKEYIVQPCANPSSANQKGFAEMIANGTDLVKAYEANYKKKRKEGDATKLAADLHEYIEFLQQIDDRQVVDLKSYQECKLMADVVRANRVCRPFIKVEGQTEVRVEWEYRGLNWVGYVDKASDQELRLGEKHFPKFMMDLKKRVSAEPRKIMREIQYGTMAIQGALYKIANGDTEVPYFIVAIDENYQSSVIHISDATLAVATRRLNAYIMKFKRCALMNEWEESHEFHNSDPSGIFSI